MKKVILILAFFLALVPRYNNGHISFETAQAVYAQTSGGSGSGGGFWGWLGGVISGIGSVISTVAGAIGDFFTSGEGYGGGGWGIEDNDYWVYDGYGGFEPGAGNCGSFYPWGSTYFQGTGINNDGWAILDNFCYFYDNYTNNTTPPCATSVAFDEETSQKYGYDNFGTNATIPWKSIEFGGTDKLKIAITPSTSYSTVFFNNNSMADLSFSNSLAPSANFTLTLTSLFGPVVREIEVMANCASTSGPNISKCKVAPYALLTKTVAVRLVHSRGNGAGYAGYTSTDVSDADIIDFLNKKCYNQGLVNWTVTRLPAMTIDFDLNRDGEILVDIDSGWMNREMIKVRDSARNDSYDANIFLVNNPSDGSTGYMEFNQRYGFVHADKSVRPPSTLAHELGHGTFGLRHTPSDTENIMFNINSATKNRLRKNQWDSLHVGHSPL